MNWNVKLPAWVTLPTLAAVVVGILFVVAQVKSYLGAPDLALTSIYRPKPVPVKVETVKWITKVETKIKRERVEVPIEVIREVPVAVERKLRDAFQIKLPDLRAEGRELVDVLEVPNAPHGGEMALTIHTATGKIDGIFRPKPAPFVELGGLREAGLEYDPLIAATTVYYRQDLLRVGPAIVNARVFVTAPLSPGETPDYGATVGVAVRF